MPLKDANLAVGYARTDITPPLGMQRSQWGGQTHPVNRIASPLLARVTVLSTAEASVALVSLDICLLSRSITTRVKRAVGKRLGAAAPVVILNCSHTHQGPVFFDFVDVTAPEDKGYVTKLVGQLAELIEVAVSNQRPHNARLATLETDGLNCNRRRPAQTTNRTLTMLRLYNNKRTLTGLLWQFAAHPVINMAETGVWCADFPGHCNLEVESTLPTVHCQFLQGAAGDAFPLDWHFGLEHPREPLGEATSQRYGRRLASLILKQLQTSAQALTPSLKTATATLDVAARPVPWTAAEAAEAGAKWRRQIPNSEYLAWPAADHVTNIAQRHPARYAAVGAKFLESVASWQGRAWPVDITAVRLGGLLAVFVPGEPFMVLQQALPIPPAITSLLLCGYSNGSPSYLPDAAAAEEVAAWSLDEMLDQPKNRWAYGATITTIVDGNAGARVMDSASKLVTEVCR